MAPITPERIPSTTRLITRGDMNIEKSYHQEPTPIHLQPAFGEELTVFEIWIEKNGQKRNIKEILGLDSEWRFVKGSQTGAFTEEKIITIPDKMRMSSGESDVIGCRLNPKTYDRLKQEIIEKDPAAEEEFEYVKSLDCDFLDLDGAFHTIFHEVGHAINTEDHALQDERISVRQQIFSGTKIDSATNDRLMYQPERKAWKSGIQIWKTLARNGYQFEPNLSPQELSRFIKPKLADYRSVE